MELCKFGRMAQIGHRCSNADTEEVLAWYLVSAVSRSVFAPRNISSDLFWAGPW